MSNVDQAEIAKFEALASRWWDLESEFKPLHDINPLRASPGLRCRTETTLLPGMPIIGSQRHAGSNFVSTAGRNETRVE